MSFDILMKQVGAIAIVTRQMGGQVSSAISKASIGQLQSPLLSAQLMVGDALRLLRLVDGLPSLESYDFEVELGNAAYSNTISWTALWQSKERLKSEIAMLEEFTASLNEALDVLKHQLYQLLMLREQLMGLQSMIRSDSTALNQARDVLDQEVLPALFKLRDTLESLAYIYAEEHSQRDFYLWHLNTVFKFVLPPPAQVAQEVQKSDEDGEEDADGTLGLQEQSEPVKDELDSDIGAQ